MRALLIAPPGDSAAFARAQASRADAVLADATAAGGRGGGLALYLRVRAFDDPGALDDLAAAVRLRPAGLVLTAHCGADVQRLGARLAVEEARQGLDALRILAFVAGSAGAVLDLPSFRGASARLAGLVVDNAALAAALRASPESGPVRLARHLALIAARAAGVPAFAVADTPETALAEGFDGVATETPEHIPLIRAAFAP